MAGIACCADDRGDVHDAAPARFHHRAHHGTAKAHGGGEIDIQHLCPILVGHPHEELIAGDACVVDEDVEPPHRFNRLLGQRFDGCRVTEIARQHVGAALQFGGKGLQRFHAGA